MSTIEEYLEVSEELSSLIEIIEDRLFEYGTLETGDKDFIKKWVEFKLTYHKQQMLLVEILKEFK